MLKTIALMMLVLSCSVFVRPSVLPNHNSKQAATMPGHDSTIVVMTKLEANGLLEKGQTCQLEFKSTQGQTYILSMLEGRETHTLKMPTGRYWASGLSCGILSNFTLNETPAFTLSPKRAFLIGHFTFNVKDKTSLDWNMFMPNNQDILGAYNKLPKDIQDNLYSPYLAGSNEKITGPMLQSTVNNIIFKLPANSETGKDIQNQIDIKHCLDREFKVNPLKLGVLQYNVKFEKGFFKSLDKVEAKSTLGPDFQQCVEAHIGSLKTTGDLDFELRI